MKVVNGSQLGILDLTYKDLKLKKVFVADLLDFQIRSGWTSNNPNPFNVNFKLLSHKYESWSLQSDHFSRSSWLFHQWSSFKRFNYNHYSHFDSLDLNNWWQIVTNCVTNCGYRTSWRHKNLTQKIIKMESKKIKIKKK